MTPIRHPGPEGTWLVRDHLEAAFFCRVPFADMAPGVEKALDAWLALVPKNTIAWKRAGASAAEPKPYDARSLAQCKAMLTPAKIAKSDLTSFSLCGPQAFNADYSFYVVGSRELTGPEAIETEANLLEISFPTEHLQPVGNEAFVSFVRSVAEALPYSAGYASLALAYNAESHVGAAGEIIAPLALRHHGLDVHRHAYTRYDLADLSPGARWLTFLGEKLVNQLGGVEALKARVPSVTVEPVGAGLMLRAGAEPEIGDVNEGRNTPLLRTVAHAIEPVTMFGCRELLPLFAENPDTLDRWERRFWN